MSESAHDSTQSITPYLYYEDVAAALKWLSRAFGFQEREKETMRNPEGRVLHTSMELGTGVILMGCPGTDYRCPRNLGQTTQSLYVMVDDVAKHFENTKASGASLLSELEDTFYGDRRYGAEDPEGHQWYFAEKIREVAPEEWQPKSEDLAGHG